MSIFLNPPLFNPLYYIIVLELWLLALKMDGFSYFNRKNIKVKIMSKEDMDRKSKKKHGEGKDDGCRTNKLY